MSKAWFLLVVIANAFLEDRDFFQPVTSLTAILLLQIRKAVVQHVMLVNNHNDSENDMQRNDLEIRVFSRNNRQRPHQRTNHTWYPLIKCIHA